MRRLECNNVIGIVQTVMGGRDGGVIVLVTLLRTAVETAIASVVH